MPLPIAPATRLSPRLSEVDLGIVAFYLIAITLFGLRFAKRGKRTNSSSLKTYFLADNAIPWWAIALSIVSAETSTLTIISIPGVAFAGDLGFLQVVLGYMLGRIVVALLFLPRYFRGEMLTAYQLIDRRFGATLHKITAGIFLLTRAAAEGVRVFAISIVVSIAIGTGDVLSIAIISALTLLYTFEGGMAAVIWTDVVQMALYVAGTVVALITLGHNIPGGWEHIYSVGQQSAKFHWLDFSLNLTTNYTFWAGILGGTFLTMASHGTDQLMVQRMLAARNLRASRLALLSSGVVIFIQFTLFLLIGVGLFVFYAAHPSTFKTNDYIFPTYIVQQMPHGISGLLVAAILAAAMSNLSAALNSLASTTVIDFYLPWRNRTLTTPVSDTPPVPHLRDSLTVAKVGIGAADPPTAASHPQIPRAPFIAPLPQATGGSTTHPPNSPNTTLISRLATIFWAIILFAIAVYSIRAGGKGHVVETGLSIASVAYGSLLGVFLLGTLTRYCTQLGAILGMICGLALNLTLWQGSFPMHLGALTIPHIAFTWYVLIGSLTTFAIGSLASLILRSPRRAVTSLLIACLTFSASAQTQPQPSVPHLRDSFIVAKVGIGAADPSTAASQPQPYDFTPVSTLITQAIAAHKLPGAVVLIGHNGQVVFEQAYGQRKLAGEPGVDGKPSPAEPMTEDTIFDMASLTKVIVTTTAILQLYEQGKLDLDAPVAKYLPEFASTTGDPSPHTLSSFAEGGGPASRPSPTQAQTWKSRITIRELLTHYSGLPEDVNLKDPWGLSLPARAEGVRRAMNSIPYGPPGLTFKYSDINFITLGVLVEKLTTPQWSIYADRPTLDIYAAQNIFNPLGMKETRFLAFDKVCGPVKQIPIPWRSQVLGLPIAGVEDFEMDCGSTSWTAANWIERAAPTAHDNEGTPATNPDYDHLLRGTVHDPTTRRMGGVAGHAGLFSTAHDMSVFCQALLDKLIHNTGPFPLKQSTLQMATSPQAPATAVATATIFTPDGQTTTGVAQRGLGWDINSPFSRPRGAIFPITTKAHPGSFGHTGFTGTSLWLDPTSDTYVIILANAIHPRGNPPISALRGQVATAAARALGLSPSVALVPHLRDSFIVAKVGIGAADPPTTLRAPFIAPLSQAMSGSAPTFHPAALASTHPRSSGPTLRPVAFASRYPEPSGSGLPRRPEEKGLQPLGYAPLSTAPTLTGIDVLEQTHFAALKPFHNIALLTNQSGQDSRGNRTIDILLHASPSIHLLKIFTPEHGLFGRHDDTNIGQETDPTTHLSVISLYGVKPADRRPKPADLKDIDAVVIDLQDIGVRFWTYEAVLGYFLETTQCGGPDLIVLDRPNPIGGLAVQGNIAHTLGYNSYAELPVRHGLTYGELAQYFEGLMPPPCDMDPRLAGQKRLTVIPMQNWHRAEFLADTHLPFTPPSPNMKTLAATILYPGIGLIEQTNISVGRGTETPFENIGAPYINANELTAYLTARKIPGITFTPTTLTIAETPDKYPSHGQTIPAIHFTITDRAALDTPELGIELLSALHHLYLTQFQLDKAAYLLNNPATVAALHAGTDPRAIAATWAAPLAAFRTATAPYLLYK